jgi:hypothetical protein
MMDAYTHRDITCAYPIAGMKARMAHAGIESALAVETWKGDNRPCSSRWWRDPRRTSAWCCASGRVSGNLPRTLSRIAPSWVCG